MEKFVPNGLKFSDSALNHFSLMLENNSDMNAIRIGVKKAGCSGYEYFFEFADKQSEADEVISTKSCQFFIDQNSFKFLKGSMVDYTEEGFNKGIKFHNPNAKSVCGCGESFNIDNDQEASDTSLKKKIKILPHEEYCPEGITFEIKSDETILEACLRNGIRIEHACEMSCACTTCHVIVENGFNSLDEATEEEEDLLDKAWGLEANSRLSCQVYPKDELTVIRIPKYTLNQVSEEH